MSYLPTAQIPADGLTKGLDRQKFENFRIMLNFQDVQAVVAPKVVRVTEELDSETDK